MFQTVSPPHFTDITLLSINWLTSLTFRVFFHTMAVPGRVGWRGSMLHSPLYPNLSTLSQSDWVEKFTSCKNKMSGFDNLSISDKLNMLIAMFRVTNFMSAITAVVVVYQGGQPCCVHHHHLHFGVVRHLQECHQYHQPLQLCWLQPHPSLEGRSAAS